MIRVGNNKVNTVTVLNINSSSRGTIKGKGTDPSNSGHMVDNKAIEEVSRADVDFRISNKDGNIIRITTNKDTSNLISSNSSSRVSVSATSTTMLLHRTHTADKAEISLGPVPT